MNGLVAVLHNVRSAHNVGSMFRTADGAGVEKIFLTGFSPTPLDKFGEYRKDLAKTALGSERTVAWEYARDPAPVLRHLRKEGYALIALECAPGAVPYGKWPRTVNGSRKFALIVGHEVNGIPPAILKSADRVFSIPMRGSKESLNVSVAFGIAVYELGR
jgi:23S rRNA (guanosine2251-2'-O)-methyltransferase